MTDAKPSPTVLGERYVDAQTGIEGIAIARTEYQHGCERVSLEWVVAGEIKLETFDAPRLRRLTDSAPIEHEQRPGGNKSPAPRAAAPRCL